MLYHVIQPKIDNVCVEIKIAMSFSLFLLANIAIYYGFERLGKVVSVMSVLGNPFVIRKSDFIS